jgi:plasmid stabilization system protein ParE
MHKTIELIGQFPQSGRPVELDVRALPVGAYPYLIYWSAESDDVWIVHVRHTARRPWNPAADRA